jgi:hypothetical protein
VERARMAPLRAFCGKRDRANDAEARAFYGTFGERARAVAGHRRVWEGDARREVTANMSFTCVRGRDARGMCAFGAPSGAYFL